MRKWKLCQMRNLPLLSQGLYYLFLNSSSTHKASNGFISTVSCKRNNSSIEHAQDNALNGAVLTEYLSQHKDHKGKNVAPELSRKLFNLLDALGKLSQNSYGSHCAGRSSQRTPVKKFHIHLKFTPFTFLVQ